MKVTLLEFNNDKRIELDPFYWIAYICLNDSIIAEWTFIFVPMIIMGVHCETVSSDTVVTKKKVANKGIILITLCMCVHSILKQRVLKSFCIPREPIDFYLANSV